MKKYYIYVYLDSSKSGQFIYDDLEFEFEPFYVGKGSGRRYTQSKKTKSFDFKSNKIKKLNENNIEIKTIIIYNDIEEESKAYELEKKVISKIGRININTGPLTNLCEGGNGGYDFQITRDSKLKAILSRKKFYENNPISEEQKQHFSKINLGEKNPFFGKHHTEKVKQEQSDRVIGINHPMFGKKHSDETIEKIKINRNKVIDNNKLKLKMSKFQKKSIIQYDLEGNFIKEFSSIKEASVELNMTESSIGRRCRNLVKIPSKFIFKFKEEKDKVLRNSFFYKIGDSINIYGKDLILHKRNKKSCFFIEDKEIISIKKDDCLFLWDKIKLED
jgi:hypothetical protein